MTSDKLLFSTVYARDNRMILARLLHDDTNGSIFWIRPCA
uniref:Uncharacterized protein n=1 Tax=Arundo donax TaxID=35708 RepID=A0A0A8YT11_ARUDO